MPSSDTDARRKQTSMITAQKHIHTCAGVYFCPTGRRVFRALINNNMSAEEYSVRQRSTDKRREPVHRHRNGGRENVARLSLHRGEGLHRNATPPDDPDTLPA